VFRVFQIISGVLPETRASGWMNDIMSAMDLCGWATMPDCLNQADSVRLRDECRKAYEMGDFRRAAVGRGTTLEVREDIRRDQIMWLQTDAASTEQAIYLAKLELLRMALNQRFFLGLFDFEGHFAIYTEGAFYRAHLDRHAGTNDRIITAILYLNEDWQPGDGGELKLWTTADTKSGAFQLIEPRMGTLVCFFAGDFWHEVLPAKKSRLSITGWFRQR
jgi:SM-20-related protein